MRILYISGFSNFGGSTKSLIYLLISLKKIAPDIDFFILTTKKVKKFFLEKGFDCDGINWISIFDNTRYGYYRKIRWIVLLRELLFLPQSIIKIYKTIKTKLPDIVHLNDATFFLYAILIKMINKNIKVVLHVRSVQLQRDNLRRKIFSAVLKKYVDYIISIDENVRESIPENLYLKIQTIHNSFEMDGKNNNNLYIKNSKFFTVGFIGVLYRAKGIYEFMEAIKIILLEKKLKSINFLIAGENTRKINNFILKFILKKLGFFQDTEKDLLDFINDNKFEENVKYLGFIEDVSKFYSQIDILVFPSHLNAVGRPVFEAGFFGIPSIVAVRNPKADTIIDMETGICIETPDPYRIAEKIELLYNDRELLHKLGMGAKNLSNKYFNANENAKKILEIYNKLLR